MPPYPENPDAAFGAALGAVPAGTAVSAVAKRLLDLFTTGDLEPGTRLPPERSLAASLGVGRSAIREALAALEILGIVDVRPGSGTYLRGSASELLPQTLSWGLMLGEPRTRELVEVRNGLEVLAVRSAAVRRTDDDLADLAAQLDGMRDNRTELDKFVEADRLFHLRIAVASGNVVLQQLLQNVRSLLRLWVERALADQGHADLALAEHELVYAALRDGDPDAAAEAMSAHMHTAAGRLAEHFGQEA
ncbi:FadR/GntR family transcriptional regulator [Saccharopolyspora sp. NPDC047091]|uniref:FadR/GntR family transcriptional regulator n=1 Tax=Saccharopolyspora sp. NPDC047091 TaxID=3155924 RepID=UPI0033ECF4FB